MGTRCQIGFYGDKGGELMKPNQLIYKHWDGYPEEVLPILLPFLQMFQDKRGLDDTEYCSAWTLWHLISKQVNYNRQSLDSNEEDVTGIDCTGYGICKNMHGDISYYYRVDPQGLTVYKVNNSCGSVKEESFEKVNFYPIVETNKGSC